MMSNNKIQKRIGRKTSPEVVEISLNAKKNKSWNEIGKIISGSKRNYSALNLSEIDKKSSEGDTIVVPGKVLSKGELTKKVRICAMGFSESAREKMKSSNSEAVLILEEMKKNPKAEGIKLLR